MSQTKIELAIEIIDTKIQQTIKNNNEKSFSNLKDKIDKLNEEKNEIYKGNENVINKVLNIYYKEIKE